MRVSHCSGFSCCGAQALGHVGFSSRGTQALTGSVDVVDGLRFFVACGIFLDRGIEPVSPTLAGRFFTTEPPGKP